MGEPESLCGGSHVSVRFVLVTFAAKLSGSVGKPGVVALAVVEQGPSPAVLLAETRTKYVTPDESPE
jgi:hypothetical protein